MIHDQRAFIVFPANWEPPVFQIGEYVQSDTCGGEIIGFEYYTREQSDLIGCAPGWWYWILERQASKCGQLYANTWGQHESVIQRVPSSAVPVFQQPVSV